MIEGTDVVGVVVVVVVVAGGSGGGGCGGDELVALIVTEDATGAGVDEYDIEFVDPFE